MIHFDHFINIFSFLKYEVNFFSNEPKVEMCLNYE
jgi:hypothetical protein